MTGRPATADETHGRRHGPRPGTARRTRMSRAEREQQLLDVAVSVFGERGFTDTTMEQIAARAGITKPVIYDHFGSKERLLVATVVRARDQLLAQVTQAVLTLPRSAPADETLRVGLRAFFTFFDERRDSFRVYQHEAAVIAAAGSDIEQLRRDQVHLIAGWVAALAHPVELSELTLDGLATIVVAANERITAWRLLHPEVSTEEAVDLVMTAVWSGLASLRPDPAGV